MRSLTAFITFLCLLCPLGCSSDPSTNLNKPNPQIVRVRIFESLETAAVLADRPVVKIGATPIGASFPPGPAVRVAYGANGWIVGNQQLPPGDLVLQPTRLGGVIVNNQSYRGQMRFVATGNGRFDVVNDVDIDDYLKGVVAKEMLAGWADEAYKAQAIVARTYALYEAYTSPAGRAWDLYPDQRSQVYGGLAGETEKSRRAVDATSRIVLVYGPPGQRKIFKSYFSSCCGGISQNPSDGLGEPFHPAMVEQNVGQLCSASPRFNWGPVVVSKAELARRFKLFGKVRDRAEQNIAGVARIDKAAVNRYGRSVRFTITDTNGTKYSLSGEELRWAVNSDAPKDQILYSSYIESADQGAAIKFTGHGYGHGVGLCQWCTQTRALQGMRHEDILRQAFPGSGLEPAY